MLQLMAVLRPVFVDLGVKTNFTVILTDGFKLRTISLMTAVYSTTSLVERPLIRNCFQ